jgi:SHS2 domain-containing protein
MQRNGLLRFTYLALASLLCLLALAACDAGGGGVTTMSNADLLKSAINNAKALKTYHTEMDVTQGDVKLTMKGDFDREKKNYKVDANAMGFDIGVIKLGDEVYTKDPMTGNYKKGDASDDSYDSFLTMWDNTKMEEIDKAAGALKDASPATETVNGVETRHITADAKDLASLSSATADSTIDEGTIDFWISTGAKPQIHRMVVDGKEGGKEIDINITWSKHDEPVTIEAPPVQ